MTNDPRRVPWPAEVRHLLAVIMTLASPEDIVRILRPPELKWLCQCCNVLEDLGLCSDILEEEEE